MAASATAGSDRERFDRVAKATGLGVWYCDLPFSDLEWDDTVKEHFWLPPDAHVTIESFYERIHPDDREPTRRAIETSIAEHTAYDIEYRTTNPRDASQFKWIKATGWTDYDGDGKPIRFDGITLDVTRRKHADEALRTSEETFRNLFLLMPAEVHYWELVRDAAGRIRTWTLVDANPPALKSWKRELPEIVGRTTDQIFGEGTTEQFRHIVERIVSTRSAMSWEDYFPATGQYMQATSFPVGERFFTILVDVSDIRRAETALKAAIRARDEFISVASHELKTPLTSMKLQAQYLKLAMERGDPSAFEPSRVKKAIEQTDRQVSRLVRLVDDMLDVSRIQNGRLAMQRERVSLPDVVREVIERLRGLITESGSSVSFDSAAEVEGFWDRFRIEQVVTNLLTNAMRYGNGKPVSVRVERHDDRAALSVRDEGIGISQDAQPRIFDRFERAVAATNVSGLGLGLYITREIVKAHEGSVRVESRPGEGSTFVVELPLEPS